MATRYVLQVVLATALLVGSVVVIGPDPAAAHGSSANGCTGVSDSGYGYSFHAACDAHDRCYGTKPYGSSWSGRRQCDRVFRSEMLGYCGRHRALSLKRAACKSRAWAYYYGVRALGAPFWARSHGTVIA
ncbi:MAG: phospholipase A2 [Acidimicrobiales bacterium]